MIVTLAAKQRWTLPSGLAPTPPGDTCPHHGLGSNGGAVWNQIEGIAQKNLMKSTEGYYGANGQGGSCDAAAGQVHNRYRGLRQAARMIWQ